MGIKSYIYIYKQILILKKVIRASLYNMISADESSAIGTYFYGFPIFLDVTKITSTRRSYVYYNSLIFGFVILQ